jgi:hypothetical protein
MCCFAWIASPLVSVVLLEWPPDTLSKSLQSNVLYDTRLEYYSTALDTFFRGHTPIARATTCRVFLQSAIQIHTWFFLFNTNDHSSSNSRIGASASFGSGATNVSDPWRELLCFFFSQTLTVFLDTPNVLVRPRMLLRRWLGSYNLFSTFFRIAIGSWIFTTLSLACKTRDIFAFHLVHNHYALILYLRSIDSILWLLP